MMENITKQQFETELDKLTKKQKIILQLYLSGLTIQDISNRYGFSISSVCSRLASCKTNPIFAKLIEKAKITKRENRLGFSNEWVEAEKIVNKLNFEEIMKEISSFSLE